MKKIYIILVTIVTLGMTSSCSDYLSIDKYVNDMLTLDTVFLRKNYTCLLYTSPSPRDTR